MDLPRQQFLAGAAFPANQNGAFPAADRRREFAQPPHRRVLAYHSQMHGVLPRLQHCGFLFPPSNCPIEKETNFNTSGMTPYERTDGHSELNRDFNC